MNRVARFRFYEELNDFLPAEKRKVFFPYSFSGTPSVKDAIEAIGVPHVEIDLILVNGISVNFSFKLRNEDSVSVYPVFESFDITNITHLHETPLRDLKFIADVHLGKLVKYLRLCGFDTTYRKDFNDQEIISLALEEKRVILTRDLGILRNHLVTRGYWLRSQYPAEQLREVMSRFDLKERICLFSRCSVCNELLSDVKKEKITPRLLPNTIKYYQEFKICSKCDRIYWQGSHYERIKGLVKEITGTL
jgi:uncharacterized protein